MAESSVVGAATVAIPPEARLRSETATGVPLTNPIDQPLPTSITSYQQRLSLENREELEKQRKILERAKRDHEYTILTLSGSIPGIFANVFFFRFQFSYKSV
jgi:hypothetical protein